MVAFRASHGWGVLSLFWSRCISMVMSLVLVSRPIIAGSSASISNIDIRESE